MKEEKNDDNKKVEKKCTQYSISSNMNFVALIVKKLEKKCKRLSLRILLDRRYNYYFKQ